MPLFNSNIDLDQNQLKGAVIHSGSTKPNNGAEVAGQIFYDTDTNQLQIYTGSDWEGVQTETKDGALQFNTALKIGRDADNLIDFTSDNQITFRVSTGNNVIFKASGEIEATSLDISGAIDVDGTSALAALTATTGTFSGILKTDDTTAATSTTDGSLQTDGGLSVALDAVIGDDLILISDAAVLSLGAGKDVTITHDNGTGGTLASAGNFVVDSTGGTLTLDGNSGVSIAGGSSEIDVTTTGALDLNSGAYTLNSAANTTTASGALAINVSGAASDISITTAHTAGVAFHLDANANAGSEVQIDAGILDIDVTAGITIDGTTLSIDGTDDSNLTVTGSAKDLNLVVAGGGTQELRLLSAGTGNSALDLTTSAGGIDINSADMITVDAADEIVVTTTSADGHISLVSAHTAGQAVHIDANANVGSILDIDAGILDIDVDDAITIDAADEIVITTTSADGHINLVSAHTAGVAFLLDANANAGSIVQIDAGILDVNVTGASSIAGTELELKMPTGVDILNVTASAADQGGRLVLACDDGAVMADNHRLGVIEFQGAEDTSHTLTLGASIEAICDAAWSSTENGASLVFKTTDANLDTDVALTLDSNQKASFGADVAIAGNLTVAGTTTTENTTIIESTVTVLQFEGADDNNHETILKVIEPTADTTFSLPALTAGNFFLPAIAGTATDASAAVTAAEFALLDGGSSIGTTAVNDGDGIVSNNGGSMMHTTVQTYQTYFDANSVGGANIVTTGALGTGTIAAGFGAIDNGTSGIRTNIFTAETSFLPDADDGATLGSANLNFSDVFLADGAVLNFGDDQDVKLTHVHGAGVLLNSTMAIQFNDASQYIKGSSNAELEIGATDQINLESTLVDLNGNLDVSGTALITGVLTIASNIVHSGDTNNLIAFGTDTQSFQTGGAARMNISDSGLQIGGGARVTTVLDQDNLSGDSATSLATQQSIKAYVDANTATDREVVLVLNNSVSGVASSDNITYAVTHGLSSRNVMVEVIRNGANSGDFRTVYADVNRTSDDIVAIVFGSARTAGDYTVMIQKIG